MYNNRSYKDRKTNINNAWTKEELLQLCKLNGIRCSNQYNKDQLVSLLVSYDSSSSLPKQSAINDINQNDLLEFNFNEKLFYYIASEINKCNPYKQCSNTDT